MTPALRGTLESQIMRAVLSNVKLRDSIRQPLAVGDTEEVYNQIKQALNLAYEQGFRDGQKSEASSGRS